MPEVVVMMVVMINVVAMMMVVMMVAQQQTKLSDLHVGLRHFHRLKLAGGV